MCGAGLPAGGTALGSDETGCGGPVRGESHVDATASTNPI